MLKNTDHPIHYKKLIKLKFNMHCLVMIISRQRRKSPSLNLHVFSDKKCAKIIFHHVGGSKVENWDGGGWESEQIC